MFSTSQLESINNCDSDSEEPSNLEEDEDELTRIIPPQGKNDSKRLNYAI